ncbi:LOW QUALITY PROTEIN: tumor necrosis factor-like [Menidia menidia]
MEGQWKMDVEAPVSTEAAEPAAGVQEPGRLSGQAPLLLPGGPGRHPLLLLLLLLGLSAAAALLLLGSHTQQSSGPHEEDFDLHHTLRQISNVRAAIHLRGEHNPGRKNSVEWRNQVEQSHSQGGLKLYKNEIVIPRDGLYFVYSQASFRVSCSSPDSSTSMVHLSHTVQRYSESYGSRDQAHYQTILHSVRTACQRTAGAAGGGAWFSAVYMGAVFDLNKGDRLKTVMEEQMLEQLEDEPGKTFFGVFAL